MNRFEQIRRFGELGFNSGHSDYIKNIMKNKIRNFYYTLILGILIPFKMLFAAGDTGVVSQQVSAPSTLKNPLGEVGSLADLVKKLLEALVLIATPIAVLFLIFAGFKFVIAKGNPEEIRKAQKTLMWTIVGIVVLLGAELLSEIVKGTIQELGQNL